MIVMKRSILRLLGILAIFFMFLTFSAPVTAHPPVDMILVYSNGNLDVTIYHTVADPATTSHYIETVQIYVNDGLAYEETYTTQPALVASFTYSYGNITAYPGDTIEVIATCSIQGSINESLVVPSPQLPLDVSVESASNEVDAGQDVRISVNVASGSDPVEDADLDPSSDNGGSFTDFEDEGDGVYTTTFTAPEVTEDTTVTITVNVAKAGHTPSEDTVEITVTAKSGGDDGDDDDDDGLPGFEVAGLLAGLVAVVLIVANKKRNGK
jgi:desulfoferrodoxin (superoxide reductase-like protein)